MFENNEVVLFQGDSVTDCGRSREDDSNHGNGYPMMIASWLEALYPEKTVKFINRGVSGDRVCDLKTRWHEDCIQLKPTFVSILVGINDCWRRYDSNDPTSPEAFEKTYRDILTQVKENTEAKILLCEPFVLPYPEDRKQWREDLDPKISIVRDLAREFKTLLLPLDGIFNSNAAYKASGFWTADGVHPTMAGHALIAQEWLRKTKCI
ncbi:MAG TPA: SGNH/GDSL hydrolase family protein [Ruminiclostridium sp.]